MVVPVDNRSYMKKATDRANRKKREKNIGAAPSKLNTKSSFTKKGTPLGRSRTKVDQSDDTGPDKKISSAKISSAPKALSRVASSAKRIKANPELYEKPERIKQSTSLKAIPNTTYDILGPGAGSKKVQPRINKETPVINKMGGYQDADQLGRARTRLGQSDDTGPSITGPSIRTNQVKLSTPTAPASASASAPPSPRVKKPEPPAKVAPKMAPRPRPKPSSRPSPSAGAMEELEISPSGENQPKASKKASKRADDGYKFYGKEGTGLGDFSRKHKMQYATQKQHEKDFDMSGGEKAGGRPGRGKLKTQGMNKAGKRKVGFSGKGSGAALRGF